MKLFLISLLVAGVQQWAGGVTAPGVDVDAKGKTVVVVKGDQAHVHGQAQAQGHADAKCNCKAEGHKCTCKAKTAKCNCKAEGHKCNCKAKTAECKTKVHKGEGIVTYTTSDDDDHDGQKVVVRKKHVTGDHGEEGKVKAYYKAFKVDDDGRSEPQVMYFGDDEGAKKNAWLGVSIDGVPGELAGKFDIEGEGVFVVNVAIDSPAEHAGIMAHDIMLSIDDDDVSADLNRAVNLIKTRKPGDKVDIMVLRDGQKKEFRVKLGELGKGVVSFEKDSDDGRSEQKKVRIKKEKMSGKQGWLGVSIGDVPEKFIETYEDADEGVIVLEVVGDSPAEIAGLRAHDIIMSVDDIDVDADAGRLVELIKKHGVGDDVEIEVLRGGDEKEFVVTLGDREGGLLAFGDDDDDDNKLVWVSEDKPEKVEKKAKDMRGWLGVSIGDVPESLATQLDIEGKGVIVLDVIDDSPADHAGFKVHDIVLSVDDTAVKGDTGRAVDLIKKHKPGDEIEVFVLREGGKKALNVELGTRPDDLNWTMKLDDRPMAEVEEEIHTRGKILKKDKSGKWIMKDLGDLGKLADLPDNIKMFVPKSGKRSISISAGDDEQKKVSVSVERDGNVIVVEREDDGEIVVTRVDNDGKKKKVVYDDKDKLREADEEAYELYEKAGDAMVVHLDVDGLREGLEDFDFNFDTEDWAEHAGEWHEHFEEGLGEAQEAYEEAMKQFHEAMKQLQQHGNLPKDIEIPELPKLLKEKGGFPGWVDMRRPGKPDHTFEVQVDGTIEVRLHKGDSELVQIFEDEGDLESRSPELYKKYKALSSVEE